MFKKDKRIPKTASIIQQGKSKDKVCKFCENGKKLKTCIACGRGR